jgi:hypothetical protein
MATRDDDKADGAAPGGPLMAMVKGCLDLAAAQREEQRHWRHVVVRHADNAERRLTDIRDRVERASYWAACRWATSTVLFASLFVMAIIAIVGNQRDQLAELKALRELVAQGVCDVP